MSAKHFRADKGAAFRRGGINKSADERRHRTDEWLSPGRFAGLLAVLIGALFPLVLTGLEAFAYGDAGQFAYPVAFYHRECFWRGEVPLWNPLSSCGLPFLAQWNTLTCYPLSLIYLLLPVPWSFGVFLLTHFFLAGLGMYFLAWKWTGHRLAAGIAGAVFAFNGVTWYALMWPHFLAGMAWMPWLVLAMQRAWCEGGRWTVVAALAGALQLLTGGAEVIIQTWFVLGVLWLLELREGRAPLTKLVFRTLASVCLAAGLASAQLLPFLDLVAHSQRSAGYGSGGVGTIAAMPLTGLFNYLVPLFHCVPNFNGVFVQAGQSWIGSYYLGVGTVALALVAIRRVRKGQVWVLASLGVFGLLLALGRQGLVYGLVERLVPVLGFIRFSVKFVVLPTFVLPLLAAMGASWLWTLPAERWPGEWKKLKWLAAVLVGLMALIAGLAVACPLPVFGAQATVINAVVRGVFLALIVAVIFLLRQRSSFRFGWLLQAGLLALFWFDVFTHSSNLSPTVPASSVAPNIVRDFFKWDGQFRPGTSRVMQSQSCLWKMVSAGTLNLEQDTAGRRLSLMLNYNLLDDVAKFDGFYPLDLEEYQDIFKHAYFGTNEAANLKSFLGISQVSNPTNCLEWASRPNALPLITAGQQPFLAAKDATLQAVLAAEFDPVHTVYLPLEAGGALHADGKAHIQIVQKSFTSRRLEIDAQSDGPAMIVIAQSYAHWWRAYVDAQPMPLWRANYAFQALEVPAGRHHVEVVYEDKSFLLGALVSGVSILVCVGAWFWVAGRAASPLAPTIT